MFAFLCVLQGTVAGCLVCAFGMWAFLEGQKDAFRVKSGGMPENIFGQPKKESSSGSEVSSNDLASQLNALFGSERGEKV